MVSYARHFICVSAFAGPGATSPALAPIFDIPCLIRKLINYAFKNGNSKDQFRVSEPIAKEVP